MSKYVLFEFIFNLAILVDGSNLGNVANIQDAAVVLDQGRVLCVSAIFFGV